MIESISSVNGPLGVIDYEKCLVFRFIFSFLVKASVHIWWFHRQMARANTAKTFAAVLLFLWIIAALNVKVTSVSCTAEFIAIISVLMQDIATVNAYTGPLHCSSTHTRTFTYPVHSFAHTRYSKQQVLLTLGTLTLTDIAAARFQSPCFEV